MLNGKDIIMVISFIGNRMLPNFFTTIIAITLFSGCYSPAQHFYSVDKTKCISIITERDDRYIINGYYDRVPKSNFIKVSLVKIDRHVADQIVGCWNKDGAEWIILMDNVIILDNKLDAKRFVFKKV